jgi:hypothetical protein
LFVRGRCFPLLACVAARVDARRRSRLGQRLPLRLRCCAAAATAAATATSAAAAAVAIAATTSAATAAGGWMRGARLKLGRRQPAARADLCGRGRELRRPVLALAALAGVVERRLLGPVDEVERGGVHAPR